MKEKSSDLVGSVILIFIALLFILMAFFMQYLQEEYCIQNYIRGFIISLLCCTPLYYFYYNTKEKILKKRAENKNIVQKIDLTYYREIMNEYSPATISFILDGIEFKKDLSACLVYLLYREYLVLDDDEIIKKTGKDYSNLPEDLKFIIENVKELLKPMESKKILNSNGHLEKIIYSKSKELSYKWFDLVPQISKEQGIVEERKQSKTSALLILLCVMSSFILLFLEGNELWCGVGIFTAFIMGFLKFSAFEDNKWTKTQKGYELYKKVVGLRNYIKDFSQIAKLDLRAIAMWDEYLIYAIIFSDGTSLTKEVQDLFNETGKKLQSKYGDTFDK